MRVIAPLQVTDAMIVSTNVPETDYPAWSAVTAYAVGARVIKTATHRQYECITANTGVDPATDSTSTHWLDIGATNRWKAFDRLISDPVVRAGGMTYVLQPGRLTDAVALFGLNAATVRIEVSDPSVERRNLITHSTALDNAAWGKSHLTVVAAPEILNPFGETGGVFLLRESASTGDRYTVQQLELVPGNHVTSLYVRQGPGAPRSLRLRLTSGGVFAGNVYLRLTTGTTYSGTGGYVVTVEPAGHGWWRLSAWRATGVDLRIDIRLCIEGETTSNYTGDGVSGIYVFGPQIEPGAAMTAYQFTTGTSVWDQRTYDVTRTIIDNSAVFDAWTYCFEPIVYSAQEIFSGLPIYAGTQVTITISGGGDVELGQIVIGRDYPLGRVLTGSAIGIEDFSRKDRDDFGNAVLIERPYAQTVDFSFCFPSDDAGRVSGVLASLRATPAVYHAGDGTGKFGTTIYGFFRDFSIPLTTNVSFANLQVEGLI